MGLIDLIFPKNCLECSMEGQYICPDCIAKVHIPKPVCPECQKPSIDGFTHIKCHKSLGLNGLTSLWRYEGVVRKALIGLKYKYATEIAKELISYTVTELLHSTDFLIPSPYCLVPVPMHWLKENNRGFNQSEILGRGIAKSMRWKFTPDLLVKKHTREQVGLKGKSRVENIKNVFSLNPIYNIQNTTYLLFDDVYTTGSTLKEAVKVLKRNGAQKVWGFTVAK